MAKAPPKDKVSELLYWSYANLAMAEMAVHDRKATYGRIQFMVRAKLYSGLCKGTMSPRSLMRDQRIRMELPQECVYCGTTEHLSIDHIVPTNRGGTDSGDNAVWACRSCNSSKSDKDLFAWWTASKPGFPPLFVVRVYLKQAIEYCITNDLMDARWDSLADTPFSFGHIPTNYPKPDGLIFTPHHARSAVTGE